VRLVASVLLIACLLNVTIRPSSTALAATCVGDEQILFFPTAPHVGGQLIVAVFSHAAHDQAILLGPAGPIAVQREPIGDSFLWQKMVPLDRAGEHLFVFGVTDAASPITACTNATVVVAEAEGSPLVASLNPFGTNGSRTSNAESAISDPNRPIDGGSSTNGVASAPADPDADALESADDGQGSAGPQETRRRRPTRTSTPEPDNENQNDNDDAPTKTPTRTPTSTREPTATRVPTSTNTPRPTATDTPEPTPTLGPASIGSLSPSRPICNQLLTISGERFGNGKSDVDGAVRIDGKDATVHDWRMTQIQAWVPQTVRAGNSRLLEIVVSGRIATREIAISC
jgi:hypothetical protein